MTTKFRAIGWIGVARDLQMTLERHNVKLADGLTPSCISCEWFDEKAEICNGWKARPPARVIAFGCEQYKDNDDIPF